MCVSRSHATVRSRAMGWSNVRERLAQIRVTTWLCESHCASTSSSQLCVIALSVLLVAPPSLPLLALETSWSSDKCRQRDGPNWPARCWERTHAIAAAKRSHATSQERCGKRERSQGARRKRTDSQATQARHRAARRLAMSLSRLARTRRPGRAAGCHGRAPAVVAPPELAAADATEPTGEAGAAERSGSMAREAVAVRGAALLGGRAGSSSEGKSAAGGDAAAVKMTICAVAEPRSHHITLHRVVQPAMRDLIQRLVRKSVQKESNHLLRLVHRYAFIKQSSPLLGPLAANPDGAIQTYFPATHRVNGRRTTRVPVALGVASVPAQPVSAATMLWCGGDE